MGSKQALSTDDLVPGHVRVKAREEGSVGNGRSIGVSGTCGVLQRFQILAQPK
jgi:hypothetical protein